jgi:phosphoribosylanthranilate isomerase
VAVFTKMKYMNIHSTIQNIYISTIQVYEHYKTQETENIEKTKKVHEKHMIYEKRTLLLTDVATTTFEVTEHP